MWWVCRPFARRTRTIYSLIVPNRSVSLSPPGEANRSLRRRRCPSSASGNLAGDDPDLDGPLSAMPRQNSARVSGAKVRRRKLQLQILELRRSGLSWRKVASRIGLSHEYCRRLYTGVLNEAADAQRDGGVGREFADWPSAPERRRQYKQEELDELLRLRAAGLSYRAIGIRVGRGKNQVQRMLLAAYEQLATMTVRDAAVSLGEELERLDGLTVAAQVSLAGRKLTAAQRLGAISELRKASETKMRWLGAERSRPFFEYKLTREELTAREVNEMTEETLEAELQALGGLRVSSPETEPPKASAHDCA
jgi:hypothetical protein